MRTELVVIQNDADHAEAMALVSDLMDATDPGDVARLRAQAKLVEDYESRRWPRQAPSEQDLLTYLLDQIGLTRADLPVPRVDDQR